MKSDLLGAVIMISAGLSIVVTVILSIVAVFIGDTDIKTSPQPCEFKVYEYSDEYHVITDCGHIVEDRCPFCDRPVVIDVE